MFKKVLIATDGSDTAHHAVRFCVDLKGRLPDIEMAVLTVTPVSEGELSLHDGIRGFPDPEEAGTRATGFQAFQAESKQVADHWRENAVARFQEAGFTVHSETGRGDPASEIVRIAQEGGYDHIVMGSHGRGTLGSLLLGSVARKVLHLAPCAVTIVKA